MSFTKLETELEGGTLKIVLNNPPRNVLTQTVRRELHTALVMAEADSAVSWVVITGSGGTFSAGADIHELREIVYAPDPFMAGFMASRASHEFLQYLRGYSKSLIASIDGYALGGGMELALGCHRIVATSRSVLGLPELSLGIVPGSGGLVLFPRRFKQHMHVGISCIEEARMLTASEAYKYGLVDGFVDVRPHPAVVQARTVSCHALELVRIFAKGLSLVPERLLSDALDYESFTFGKACARPDAREGIDAFLENRRPRFEKTATQ